MKTLVSVIVPVYNTSFFLEECLFSLENQSFEDYEVLIIDDGSTDNSSEICKKFIIGKEKFRYFKKQNGGLSSARNFGIKKASGNWLMFVDSDDIVSSDFLLSMYESIKHENCMLGVCKYQKFTNKILLANEKYNLRKITKNDYLLQMFDTNFMVACNKIYHKSLFENIEYPEGFIHEDFATTYKLVDMVDNIAILNQTLYFYRNNPNSITLSKIKNNKLDLLKIYKMQIEYFGKKKTINPYKLLYKKCSNQFFACFGTLLSYKKENYSDFKNFKEKISSFYKENFDFIKILPLSFVNRIIFIFSFKRVSLIKFISVSKRKLHHGA